MTIGTRNTVGFLPSPAQTSAASLRTIIRPWVEREAITAPEIFHDDFRIVGKRRPADGAPGFDLEVWATMLADQVDVYKRHSILFRYVANAVLAHYGVHETRPVMEYESDLAISGRLPAAKALAHALTTGLKIVENPRAPLRSPLEVLATISYGDKGQRSRIAADELAVLFNRLVQTVGMPAWFVIDRKTNHLTVEAEVGHSRNNWKKGVISFDPSSGDLIEMRGKHSLPSRVVIHESPTVDEQGVSGYAVVTNRKGQYPKDLERLVGTGRLEGSRYWKRPTHEPPWFSALESARQQFQESMHDPIFSKVVLRGHRTVIAENRGPNVTGAIIAYLTKLYTEQYAQLFRAIISHELRERGVDAPGLEAKGQKLTLATEIARLIKDYFAYREEMWKVEEILSPLAQWEIHAYRPHEQCHDCDDLTLNTMTAWESFGIASAVRLAGDPPPAKTHYHVYPLAIVEGRTYPFDVSAHRIFDEMNHGGNKIDFVPRDSKTFMGPFQKAGITTGHLKSVAGCDCVRFVEHKPQSLL